MGITLEQIRRLTIQAQTEGLEAAEASLKAIAGAQEKVAASGEAMARTTDSGSKTIQRVGKDAAALAAKYDGAAKAAQELERDQKRLATAINQGAVGSVDAARVLALMAARHDLVATAAKRSTDTILNAGKAGAELSQVQRQMLMSNAFNTLSSIGTGNPMQILMQQGPDLAQAFSMGPQGVGGTFRALGGVLSGLLTPTVALGGAFAALAGAGAYGFIRFRSETETLAHSLEGLGRRSGETLDSLQALAARGAGAGGMSLSSSRELAATYTGAGLGGGLTEDLIGRTKAFARVTGVDMEAAGKTLAAAFADPTKGAQQLGDAMGFLDEKTRVSIASFQAQGDILKAQQTLLDALAKNLDQAADRTGVLGRLWQGIAKSASDAASAMGHAVDIGVNGPSPAERLQALQEQLVRLQHPGETAATAFDPSRWNDQAWQGAAAGRWGSTGDTAQARLAAMEDNLHRQREIQRLIDRQNDEAAAKSADAKMAGDSTKYAQAVYSILPELERRRALTDQISLLQKAADNPAMLDHMKMSADDLNRALRLTTDQAAQTLSLMDKLRLEGDLALRGIAARSDAERAMLARDKALGGVAPGAASPELALKAANDASLVMAQAQRDAQDRLRTANDNLRMAGMLPYQRQMAEIGTRWDWQDKLNAGNPGALAKNQAARQAELEALSRTAGMGPIQEANRALESQNRLLLVNAATFGQSTDKVVAARTQQEMLNRYLEQGVPLTDQMRAGIAAYADGMGRAALAAEDLQRRQQNVVHGMDELRSTSNSVFSSLLKGDAAGAIQAIKDKAIDAQANMITSSLFGQQGKPGGGLFGDFFGGLFGQMQGVSVGTQNVTAGAVNIMGGISGLGGAGGLGIGGGLLGPTAMPQTYTGGALPALASRATGYSPQLAGDRVEGGYASSIAGPDGQAMVRTLDDYRAGRSDYVTLAGNPQYYGNRYTMPEVNYQSGGQNYTLSNVPGVVHDTGSAFQSAPEGRFDVALGRDMSFAERNQSMSGVQFVSQQQALGNETQRVSESMTSLAETSATTTSSLGSFGNGLSQIFNGLGSAAGGFFKFLGFASGGAFLGGVPIAFASGGVVGSPTVFGMSGGRMGLMGEAGPEAIMPLARGGDGRLGVRMHGPMPHQPSGMASSVRYSPSVTINYQGAPATSPAEADAHAKAMSAAAIKALDAHAAELIRQQMRPGGLLYGAQRGLVA